MKGTPLKSLSQDELKLEPNSEDEELIWTKNNINLFLPIDCGPTSPHTVTLPLALEELPSVYSTEEIDAYLKFKNNSKWVQSGVNEDPMVETPQPEFDEPVKKTHRCSTCCLKFTKVEYLEHLDCVHPIKKCKYCKFKCGRAILLKRHYREFHDNMKICTICNTFQTKSWRMYDNHIRDNHFLPYRCGHCLSTYNTFEILKHHIRSKHMGERNFKCPHCDFTASKKFTLTNHIQGIHDKNKPYKCDQCSYHCLFPGQLEKHKLKKHQPKIILCPKCKARKRDTPVNKMENNPSVTSTKKTAELTDYSLFKDPSNHNESYTKNYELCNDNADGQHEEKGYQSSTVSPSNFESNGLDDVFTLANDGGEIDKTISEEHKSSNKENSSKTIFVAEKEKINLTRSGKHKSLELPDTFSCSKCSYIANSKSNVVHHYFKMHPLRSAADLFKRKTHSKCSECLVDFPDHSKNYNNFKSAVDGRVLVNRLADGNSTFSYTFPKPSRKVTCNICNKIYAGKSAFNIHMRGIHLKNVPRPYKCEECDFSATHFSSLKKHISGLHAFVNFKCKQCKFLGYTQAQLDKHRKRKKHFLNLG